MFRKIAVASVLPAAVSFQTFVPEGAYNFEDFVAEFQRNYVPGTEEFQTRKAIFEENLDAVLAHNAAPGNTWTSGLNQYSDMTRAEFRESGRFGYDWKLGRHLASDSEHLTTSFAHLVDDLPARLDWREHGVVSDVKDQGECGSCWAFATTETVESQVAMNNQTIVVLSPQQLASCAANPDHCGGSGGCKGSVPEVAYKFVMKTGMINEWMMPYTSYYGQEFECALNTTKTPAVIKIDSFAKLTPNSYSEVMAALVHQGPMAVNVMADGWHNYAKGIYDGCSDYDDVHIDHVVQLVGYGTEGPNDYWLVRNSWDSTWGEKGYIRLLREAQPKCGTDKRPLDGTGCTGGPATQHVCGMCGVLFDVSYPVGARIVSWGHHHINSGSPVVV